MFQMAKVWVDPNDRVDSVEIRYTWSPVGTSPDFTNGKDEAEVMQVVLGTNPRVRQAIIQIPRYFEGKDNYLLHYHFGGAANITKVLPKSIPKRSFPGRSNISTMRVRLLKCVCCGA